ncbi:hypothetical protein F2Q68_00026483 [Brassica cretica]|uniref:Ubiquitin-like protease family profile domain-containing protein n=1 Tax=Brassica cretica TaxID=69181 RepID=A0A8S9I7U0_BRACR|nr:hypothetical protein F2Q68_00026483 [Brassica cretica]
MEEDDLSSPPLRIPDRIFAVGHEPVGVRLVMVEAIPALTEVVNDGSSSGSEGDGGEDDDLVDEDKNGKRSISPGHARDTDAAGKVAVHSIIVEDKEHFKASPDLGWSDDEEDPIVDNLMSLLEHPFNKSSFTGGVTNLEIPVSSSAQTVNVSNVARDGQHPDIRRTSLHHVGIHTESAENDIINDTIRFANQTTSLTVDGLNGGQGIQLDVPSENQTPRIIPEKWSRTTPYSQTKKHHPQTRQVIQPVIHTENQTRPDSHEEMITDDPPDAILFSNQANTFAVDVLNGAQESQSSIHTEYQTLRGGAQKSGAEDMVASYPDAERYYLPFNLDKKHWVSVCVDCTRWSIVVMDCNIALRTDSMMVKEVTPIAQMFPYLLKQGGKQLLHKDARAFSIERPRSIPQNTFHADSAVSALLLVQAHAVAGVDVCKCITPDKIGSEVEKMAVRFYEATVGML